MKIFYSSSVKNVDGNDVGVLIFVTKSYDSFSMEHQNGTTIKKWRKGDNSLYGINKCQKFESMKDVLSIYGNNTTVSSVNSFHGLVQLIQEMYKEEFRWIWKDMTQSERNEFYEFLSPVYDANVNSVCYEQFRKLWNQVASNFDFIKNIKNGNNKIVRMLESTPDGSFKKGHFYMCERMDCHNALLVGEFNVRSIVSLNLIENGDKLFEQGNAL